MYSHSSCTHHREQTRNAPLPESDIPFSLVGEERVEPFATGTDVMVSSGSGARDVYVNVAAEHLLRHFCVGYA